MATRPLTSAVALAVSLVFAAPTLAATIALEDTAVPGPTLAMAPNRQEANAFLPQSKLETMASLAVYEDAPEVVHRVLPEYPVFARTARLQGVVYARLLVDQTGRVVQIGQVRGPSAFCRAVRAVVRRWEFYPALQGNLAVKAWVTVPFSFEL